MQTNIVWFRKGVEDEIARWQRWRLRQRCGINDRCLSMFKALLLVEVQRLMKENQAFWFGKLNFWPTFLRSSPCLTPCRSNWMFEQLFSYTRFNVCLALHKVRTKQFMFNRNWGCNMLLIYGSHPFKGSFVFLSEPSDEWELKTKTLDNYLENIFEANCSSS